MSNTIMQEKLVLQPSEEELKAFATIAKKSFKEKLSLTQKAIEEDQEFASIVKTPLNPEEMLVKGTVVLGAQFAITSAFIHSWISTNTPLHFSDMDVRFKADVWGVGLGGGVVWLSGWMSESTGTAILGDVHFVFNTTPIHTEISFFKGTTPIGVLVGGGLNIQSGVFGGKGSLEKW